MLDVWPKSLDSLLVSKMGSVSMDPLLSMIVRMKLKSTKHSAQSQAHSKQVSSASYYYFQGMFVTEKGP